MLLIGRARVIEVTSRTGIAAEDLARSISPEDIRRADQDAQLAARGARRVPHRLRRRHRSRAREHLVEHGIKVVGVDYLSVEQFRTPGAPAHHVLLGAGTIVIEGLNLRDVEPGIYEMSACRCAIVGSDGAPARVVLRQS